MTEHEIVTTVQAQPATTELSLPESVRRRGINESQWRTLMSSLYPGAKGESVLMVWDYCVARRLDPMKKPCHIVPIRVKNSRTGSYEWRDVVMPGIYEFRTTAMRTGTYLGQSRPAFGPETEFCGVKAPEWCEVTIYRWNSLAGKAGEFTGRAVFAEVVGLTKDGEVNERWRRASSQMLTKCAESDGLRRAFPDEFGGISTVEEAESARVTDSMLANPRDGMEEANFDTVNEYVSRIADIVDSDFTEEQMADAVFKIHIEELHNQDELYADVQKKLRERKILTARGLSDLLHIGSKRYQEQNAPPVG